MHRGQCPAVEAAGCGAPQWGHVFGIASGMLRTFSNIGMVFSFAVAILIASRSISRGLAFAIFYAALGLPMARLADRWNRKHLIIISIVIFSAATVASGMAGGFISLMLARVLVGIGEAGPTPEIRPEATRN